MFEQTFKNIDDILHKDAGCSNELDYIEQTSKTLLKKLDEAGFGNEQLTTLQKLIDADKSDLFDVLEYVLNSDIKPISREASDPVCRELK